MKIKRFATLFCAVMMVCSVLTVSASASNNTDVNFSVPATSTTVRYANNESAQRMKKNTSGCYVNYTTRVGGAAASGPYQFQAFIYGADSYYGQFVDCSSYTVTGASLPKAIVTRGSVGLIHQKVYEVFGEGSYGQIWGCRVSGYASSTAKGCWSVDSVGSYTYYN